MKGEGHLSKGCEKLLHCAVPGCGGIVIVEEPLGRQRRSWGIDADICASHASIWVMSSYKGALAFGLQRQPAACVACVQKTCRQCRLLA